MGYTNAGKSSMLNAITDAGVEAEDRLFVTLDPRTRQRQLPGGETVLFTDTVGFISNLPHDLVDAFMSTLKSVQLADLLVHVVDGSNDHAEEQIAAVREVLREIDADHVPELLVFNKADVPGSRARDLAKLHEGSVWVSAVTHENLDAVIATIGERLRAQRPRGHPAPAARPWRPLGARAPRGRSRSTPRSPTTASSCTSCSTR